MERKADQPVLQAEQDPTSKYRNSLTDFHKGTTLATNKPRLQISPDPQKRMLQVEQEGKNTSTSFQKPRQRYPPTQKAPTKKQGKGSLAPSSQLNDSEDSK